MSATALAETHGDPHASRDADRDWSGPAPKRVVTGYGFWIFILSDMIMFAAFFATYAVLHGQTAGGPSGHDLFNLRNVAIETGLLLASSFSCGLASIAADERKARWFQIAMAVTAAFGFGFLALEGREFADLVARGAGPTRSAFLSAFFTLVGCHGLHVSAGILWLLTMMAQVFAKGFRPDIQRRILCFALFWHALDIIWIAVFTVVYLLGSAPS
jgi:cytochrome o ubiquinol oxidase subunit 3